MLAGVQKLAGTQPGPVTISLYSRIWYFQNRPAPIQWLPGPRRLPWRPSHRNRPCRPCPASRGNRRSKERSPEPCLTILWGKRGSAPERKKGCGLGKKLLAGSPMDLTKIPPQSGSRWEVPGAEKNKPLAGFQLAAGSLLVAGIDPLPPPWG